VRTFLITLLLAVAVAGGADAASKHKGPKLIRPDTPAAGKGLGQGVTGEQAALAVFSDIEKRLIRDFFGDKTGKGVGKKGAGAGKYKGKSKTMPPGLANRGELPPGLQKHLERFDTLPPGLAKRDLSYDLQSRLPRLGVGLARKIIGNDVVLIEEATGVVLDILEGVLGQQ
jgi:hypothetical protein